MGVSAALALSPGMVRTPSEGQDPRYPTSKEIRRPGVPRQRPMTTDHSLPWRQGIANFCLKLSVVQWSELLSWLLPPHPCEPSPTFWSVPCTSPFVLGPAVILKLKWAIFPSLPCQGAFFSQKEQTEPGALDPKFSLSDHLFTIIDFSLEN